MDFKILIRSARLFIFFLLIFGTSILAEKFGTLTALPSSLRLNPVSGKIFEDRPDIYSMRPLTGVLEKNWRYDGKTVRLSAGRNQSVSFQAVVKKKAVGPVKNILVWMDRFRNGTDSLSWTPEIYLEWFVEVKTPSTGYEKSSLGPGWYPDALIPLNPPKSQSAYRWNRDVYLELPDFKNRITGQAYMVFYLEQYLPFATQDAPPGIYHSKLSVASAGDTLHLPIELRVWNFALPRRGRLLPNVQHGGMARMDSAEVLEVYQYFKRHRITPVEESGYRPLATAKDGGVLFDWTEYDRKLKIYLTGEAFTKKYGYEGPGEGEPLEHLLLPFNIPESRGWWHLDHPESESTAVYQSFYQEGIKQIRAHILPLVDTSKTQLIVFLNGLDESNDEKSRQRMLFYGKLFRKNFPESKFRIDGGYSTQTMQSLKEVVDIWCCHTISYNIEKIQEFRSAGKMDWFYGPLLYEGWNNAWCGSITFLDLELNHDRAASWIAFKYGATTWASWGIFMGWKNAWYDPETFKNYYNKNTGKGEGPALRLYNGNAQLIYAKDVVYHLDRPAPTLRLKSMRDGVEEYELLRLLADFPGGKAAAENLTNGLIYSPLGKKSVGNLDVWNHNAENWDITCLRLEEMVDSLSKKARK